MLTENTPINDSLAVGCSMSAATVECIPIGHARILIQHRRPTRFLADGEADPASYVKVGDDEEILNQITNSGRDFLHQQGYQTSGLGANGLNYIGLTNTAITPAAGDTTLSGEIVSNGLARAQGAVGHTVGTNTTTITYTFTCATAPQSAQAAALFTASSVGTMNHELTFSQRALQIGDQLAVTYTITLG